MVTDTTHSFPAAHVSHLVDLVARWNVSEETLLEDIGWSRQDLLEPGRTLPLDAAIALFERARKLTGERGIGVYLGLQMRASAHGFVGLAAMTADTLGEAIRVTLQYAPTRTTAIELRGSIEGDAAVLTLQERADLGGARDILLTALFIGLWQAASTLTGRDVNLTMELAIPEPDYYPRFANLLLPTRFDCPANRLIGRSDGLSSRLVMADAVSCRLAREQCDQLLGSLGLDGRYTERVRGVLRRGDLQLSTFNEVAQELGVSTRTLRRRLTSENTSFASLSHGVRNDRAIVLLRTTTLSVDEIADRLGYATTPGFTRAFRQWTGTTPTAYRREH